MSLKKKLLGTGLVAVMSLGFATGALASPNDVVKKNEVSLTIKSANIGVGGLDLVTSPVQNGGFGEIELEANPKTHYASFQKDFTVKDLRGTHEGWLLTVEASQFDNGSHKLPKGSLTLDGVKEIKRVGQGSSQMPKKELSQTTVIDNGAVKVANAKTGTGMGVFDISFDNNALGLTVDATTAKVGNYKSTLTWNLHATPDAN